MSDLPRDEDTNRYEKKYTDSQFVEVVRSLDTPTTGDVVREVGCSHSTGYDRLVDLADRGELESQMVGNANVWFLVD